jgi:hypothetical protein
MSIEPIGLLTILIGLICVYLGYRATFATLVPAALFGSAAAVLIGGANIQPGHLFLAFAALTVVARRQESALTIEAAKFPQPGFWLLCLVIYGVIGGFMIPRLAAGSMEIIPLGTSVFGDTGYTVPLGPVSSNFTQSIYLVADFICFLMTAAVATTRAGFLACTAGLLAYAAGNVLFALIDLVTYNTGTQWLLDFMRNAQYTLHIEEEVIGLKRIVGSFPEASAFAHSTIAAVAFTGTMWLCGRISGWTGTLAIASLALLVLSTSSAGLATVPPLLIILYVTALNRCGFDLRNRPYMSAALLCAPLLIVAAILAAQLNADGSKPIRDYLDALIFSKSTTDSGVVRGTWNSFALQNFFDSYGFGVGLGTARASSFPIAFLSNVGIPGAIFYLSFAATGFLRRRGIPRTFPSDVRLAARNACIALIIGDTFAGTTVEQGLLFYVLAGVACAEPERYIEHVSLVPNQPVGART